MIPAGEEGEWSCWLCLSSPPAQHFFSSFLWPCHDPRKQGLIPQGGRCFHGVGFDPTSDTGVLELDCGDGSQRAPFSAGTGSLGQSLTSRAAAPGHHTGTRLLLLHSGCASLGCTEAAAEQPRAPLG